jgi:membrane protein DedA with SNARE-associated domain
MPIMDLQNVRLEEFISRWGYAAILVGTFFEGETILVLGGFLAHLGYLAFAGVVAAAFAGTVAGDQFYYLLGRLKGMKLLERHRAWQRKAGRVFALLRRHQNLVIVGFRFLYGFRTVTPFLIGASGVTVARFTVFNSVGAAAWALVIAGLGYGLGETLVRLLPAIKYYQRLVMAAIIVIGLALWAAAIYSARGKPRGGRR